MREARAQSYVDDAFRRGYLTGPMTDWAPERCQVDEASFDAFIPTATPYAKGGSILPGGPPRGADARAKGSPLAEAVCAQLGISSDRLADQELAGLAWPRLTGQRINVRRSNASRPAPFLPHGRAEYRRHGNGQRCLRSALVLNALNVPNYEPGGSMYCPKACPH
ncbi:hypothetical protein [Roseovarius dicentrarchi]|uniref:hypothetical protein n=1 Tax=Roseovarius dicentrarchi TaxID=2250573 RepID=UPI000DEB7924|nr:hypothetical protein [Roseovarius dicentrarchi]